MGSGFSKMKKQAKMMQAQMGQMRQDIAKQTAEGSSGGGLVTLVINGEKEIQKITIKPECVSPNDIEGLQDLIIAAHADALSKLPEPENPLAGGGFPFL
jgi:DNA-binding YbaB/EbfC family protein